MNTSPASASSGSRGDWLRQQRQSRGWSVPEMRRHLREAAKEAGDTLPSNECLGVMIRRWEKDGGGGISERYRLHYCRAFKIPLDQFGLAAASTFTAPDARPESPPAPVAAFARPTPADDLPPAPADDGLPGPIAALPALAKDGPRELDDALLTTSAGIPLADEVARTACRGREHAQRAEGREIGDASLERLRSDVTRLSRDYMTAEPLPLFFQMRDAREQLYLALERKIWPRDRSELYFLLGCLTSLMADTADTIGSPAAEELARAGLAYAQAIDHRPLTAQLRLSLAASALWANRPRHCLYLAQGGLSYHPAGPNAAKLYLMIARAAARLGDAQTATSHLSNAAQVMDADYTDDDLLQIGGQFSFTRACYHYLAGSAAAELPGDQTDAASQLDQAVRLYTISQDASEDLSEHCHMLARLELAAVLLRTGNLDAASTIIGPVLALPPSRRTARLHRRLARTCNELAGPRYRTDTQAANLGQQIEQYSRDTITTRLHQTVRPSW